MKSWPVFVGLVLALASARGAERIVAAGSSVTETVFALGCGDRVVGVDLSSVYPWEKVSKLPKVGYFRQLGAEGVLALRPTLLLCGEDAGPPSVLAQIEAAGVRVIRLPQAHSSDSAIARVLEIGERLGMPDRARELAGKMEQDLRETSTRLASRPDRPAVLFVMSHGGGTPNVSGRGTAAHAMIELAGARNAITAYEGYKPLTAESALTAAPDFVLTTTRSLETMGGSEGLLKSPGLAHTPAGRSRRVLVMDDLLLLNFGPRLGEAVRILEEKLHGASCPLSAGVSHGAP